MTMINVRKQQDQRNNRCNVLLLLHRVLHLLFLLVPAVVWAADDTSKTVGILSPSPSYYYSKASIPEDPTKDKTIELPTKSSSPSPSIAITSEQTKNRNKSPKNKDSTPVPTRSPTEKPTEDTSETVKLPKVQFDMVFDDKADKDNTSDKQQTTESIVKNSTAFSPVIETFFRNFFESGTFRETFDTLSLQTDVTNATTTSFTTILDVQVMGDVTFLQIQPDDDNLEEEIKIAPNATEMEEILVTYFSFWGVDDLSNYLIDTVNYGNLKEIYNIRVNGKHVKELETDEDNNGEKLDNTTDNQGPDGVTDSIEDNQALTSKNKKEEEKMSPYAIAGIIIGMAFIATIVSVLVLFLRKRRNKSNEMVREIREGVELPMNITPDEEDGDIMTTHVQQGLVQEEIPYSGDDSVMEHDQLVYEALSKDSDIDIVYTPPSDNDEENDDEHNKGGIIGASASPSLHTPPRIKPQDSEDDGECLLGATQSPFASLSSPINTTSATYDLEGDEYSTNPEAVITEAENAQSQQLELNADDYPLTLRNSPKSTKEGLQLEQLSPTKKSPRSPSHLVTRNFSFKNGTKAVPPPPIVRRSFPVITDSHGDVFVGGPDAGDVVSVDGNDSFFSNRSAVASVASGTSPARQQPPRTRHQDPTSMYDDTDCNKLDNFILAGSWEYDEDAPSDEKSS